MKTNGIQLFNPTKQVVVADSGANGLFVLPVLDGSNLVNLPIQSGGEGSAPLSQGGPDRSGRPLPHPRSAAGRGAKSYEKKGKTRQECG